MGYPGHVLRTQRAPTPGWLGAQVGGVDLVHHPSEAEQVLRLLPAQLRALRSLPPAAGASLGCPENFHVFRALSQYCALALCRCHVRALHSLQVNRGCRES